MPTAEKHFELAVNLSIEALKSLLFVNAAAAGALIALTDRTCSHNYRTAVLCFGSGAVAAVFAFTFGYFSQLSYANHRMYIEAGEGSKAASQYRWHLRSQCMALAFVALALMASIAGTFFAWLEAH